jgi:hypothetical protein
MGSCSMSRLLSVKMTGELRVYCSFRVLINALNRLVLGLSLPGTEQDRITLTSRS